MAIHLITRIYGKTDFGVLFLWITPLTALYRERQLRFYSRAVDGSIFINSGYYIGAWESSLFLRYRREGPWSVALRAISGDFPYLATLFAGMFSGHPDKCGSFPQSPDPPSSWSVRGFLNNPAFGTFSKNEGSRSRNARGRM